MASIQSPEQTNNINRRRLNSFVVIVAITIIILLARLFQIQILEGDKYKTRAFDNRTREISVQTVRGKILDRNGEVLARNVASYNVTIVPGDLPDDEGAQQAIFRKLSLLIDMPVHQGEVNEVTARQFTPCFNNFGIAEIAQLGGSLSSYDPIKVKCNIDEETAAIILEKSNELPGVQIEDEVIREYPTGDLTAELVGFLGPIPAVEQRYWEEMGFVTQRDKVGYAGVETSMNQVLIGKNGTREVEVDNAGLVLRDIVAPVNPVPGNNVALTIDTRLQAAARSALVTRLNTEMQFMGLDGKPRYKTYFSGVVIAMDPNTGEILAMVSYPNYENNRMARIIPGYYYQQLNEDPHKPLMNTAISAELPPGSVFKLATSIGILNEHVVTPDTIINCPGIIELDETYLYNDQQKTTREYWCYVAKSGGEHGDLNFQMGFALSCDSYFYKVGGGYKTEVPTGLNIWRLGEYARALGYGHILGIELPGETDGTIPDPNWKRITYGENWSTGDTYISSIGQSFVLSTPLQVLVSIATLANGGKLVKPTIIHDITDPYGNVIQPFEPKVLWDITKDPVINTYDENFHATGVMKTVEPWVVEEVQVGMRNVVANDRGTAHNIFKDLDPIIPTAGKTGTAEYCDNIANEQGKCKSGAWPAHAWYIGYAPYDKPEIAVVAFVYDGDEGALVAAPVVKDVIKAFYQINHPEMFPNSAEEEAVDTQQ